MGKNRWNITIVSMYYCCLNFVNYSAYCTVVGGLFLSKRIRKNALKLLMLFYLFFAFLYLYWYIEYIVNSYMSSYNSSCTVVVIILLYSIVCSILYIVL